MLINFDFEVWRMGRHASGLILNTVLKVIDQWQHSASHSIAIMQQDLTSLDLELTRLLSALELSYYVPRRTGIKRNDNDCCMKEKLEPTRSTIYVERKHNQA